MGKSALKDKTAKGLFWGGLSNGVQQLLQAAFGLYLARMLTPGDYGLVAMLAVFSLSAQTIQEGGFVSALINRKEYRAEDYNSVFWFNILISLLCYAILFSAAPLIARFFHQPVLTKLARWSFLGFVLCGLGTAQRAYLTKRLMVKELAITNIVAIAVSGLVGVYLAWKGFAYWTLVIQSLVMMGLTTLGYWLFSSWKPSFRITFQPVKEMFRYAMVLLATGLLVIVNNYLMTLVLGRYYSTEETGYYSQSSKWYMMGNSVLIGMIGSVAQPVLVEVSDDRSRQLRVFRKMMRFAAFVAFPAMLGLGFIAPEFISFFLTDKWAASIPLLQILCIGGAFIPMTTLCSNLVLSKGKSKVHMRVNLLLLAALLLAAFLLYPFGIRWMVVGITVINALMLLVWVLIMHREIGYTVGGALGDVLPFLGIALLSIGAAYLLTKGVSVVWLRMLLKIVFTVLVYVLIMWISQSVTFKDSIIFVKERIKH